MQIKNVNALMLEILKEYRRTGPEGWRILRGKDERGHYDTFVLSPYSLWHMKTEWKTPVQPVGVGAKVAETPNEIIKYIMEKGELFPIGEIYPQRDLGMVITLGVGKFSSHATQKIKDVLSERQRKLDLELEKQLRKLLVKEDLFKEFG